MIGSERYILAAKKWLISRMLKKPASGVLVLNASSTYPEGTPPVRSSPAALLTAFLSILRVAIADHQILRLYKLRHATA